MTGFSSTRQKERYRRTTDAGHTRLPPGLPSLKKWFQRSHLALPEQQYEQLWLYHNMLRDKNEEYDLTRIYQFDNMVQKHYIDCILVAKLLTWRLPSPILDIGTGAGFPGIPLKIVCPETEFILSEGRHRRVQFLREVLTSLRLTQVEIHEGKIYASFSRPVKAVITRALESIPKTLARIERCLVPKGKAIFMKGPHCDEEIHAALDAFRHDYRLERDTPYTIPQSSHHRRLVVFERM
jgi:16S rRNA (guanine(527)-N(7))-methyltransferase RsmG